MRAGVTKRRSHGARLSRAWKAAGAFPSPGHLLRRTYKQGQCLLCAMRCALPPSLQKARDLAACAREKDWRRFQHALVPRKGMKVEAQLDGVSWTDATVLSSSEWWVKVYGWLSERGEQRKVARRVPLEAVRTAGGEAQGQAGPWAGLWRLGHDGGGHDGGEIVRTVLPASTSCGCPCRPPAVLAFFRLQ